MVAKPSYEIPTEMRDFAERSVDQARKAFDGFMSAAHRAADTLEESAHTVQSGAEDIGRKAMGYAEQNVSAALDFASRLVNARNAEEILHLQSEFLRRQLETFGEQAKDIGSAASKLAANVVHPER